jgi:hypothetical protein
LSSHRSFLKAKLHFGLLQFLESTIPLASGREHRLFEFALGEQELVQVVKVGLTQELQEQELELELE